MEYVHSDVVFQKYLNSVGRNDNFLAMARKLPIRPTSLDIFDVRQHIFLIYGNTIYMYVFYTYPSTNGIPMQ